MKKSLIIAGLACVALAACTKNEVVSVAPDQEITFQTIETKAASGFNTNHAFQSYAFFLQSEDWSTTNASSSTEYIHDAKITWNTNCWKDASTVHYWPKQGKLTFFAWSDDTGAPSVAGPAVTCKKTEGVKVSDFDITATANRNKDLLVAKIAANKIANDSDGGHTYGTNTWTSGVNTEFYHILSNLVFTAKTDADYSGVTFKVNSIEIQGVNTKGTYTQGVDPSKQPTDVNFWTDLSEKKNIMVYKPSATVPVTYSGATLNPEASDYSIVLPQVLPGDAKIVIKYQYTTNYGAEFDKEFTEEKLLSAVYTDNWKSGKKYTLNITFTLNEILWDPSVEEWATGTTQGITL